MTIEQIQLWLEADSARAIWAVALGSVVVFFVARFIIARGLVYLAERTRNQFDDIIVESLRPFRIAYLAPLFVIYAFAYLWPASQAMLQNGVVLLTLWVLIATLNSLLNAVNQIYENREGFSGVSIQGYLDLVKLLFVIIGIILSISLITGQSPLILLSGLGALTAVLLLIFRDTLLSLVASIQISTQDLVKQGDWIEVPSFGADGDVIDMTLHNIVIQNWDKTISVVPTYKLLETPYRNWRGMSESGGRRMKRSLSIDLRSIRFLTEDEIKNLKHIDLLTEYLESKERELAEHNARLNIDAGVPVNGRRLTNIGTFRAYVEAYIRRHPDVHQEGMTLLVRQLAPSAQGLPIEVYAFTKSTVWAEYEAIQADVFDHLIATVPHFGLKVYQELSGELGAS